MTKIWRNNQDVKDTVKSLADIMDDQGWLPDVLVKSVKEILAGASKGPQLLFFSYLQQESRGSMAYFQECLK
jgi:hypothetical protein